MFEGVILDGSYTQSIEGKEYICLIYYKIYFSSDKVPLSVVIRV